MSILGPDNRLKKIVSGCLFGALAWAVVGASEGLFYTGSAGNPRGLDLILFLGGVILTYGLWGAVLGSLTGFLLSLGGRERGCGEEFSPRLHAATVTILVAVYGLCWAALNVFERLSRFRPPVAIGISLVLGAAALAGGGGWILSRKASRSGPLFWGVVSGLAVFFVLIAGAVPPLLLEGAGERGVHATVLGALGVTVACALVSLGAGRLISLALWGRQRMGLEAPQRGRRRGLLVVAAAGLLIVAAGIVVVGHLSTTRSGRKGVAANKPNVLFVCFDALRADHLSSYGYLRQTTPTIDRLAAEGTRFEWAISQAAFTMPSMISFFTGNTPLRHGVRDFLDVLPARSVTLAEILGDYGYTTAAFVSNNTLLREWGYDQGFATYDKSARFRFSSTQRSLLLFGLLARILPVGRGSDARSTTDAVMRWITRDPRQPFFMWLHYMDSHSPYEPPPPYDVLYDSTYTDHDRFQRLFGELKSKIEEIPDVDVRQYVNERDLSHLAALYDGETRFADDQFGRLVSLLRSRGVLDRTLVVVTADHGEALGDHNCLAHNYYLYDETQRIPLIMRYPALLPAGRPVGEQVRAIDVMPTILEILGIPSPGAIEGRSLLGLVLGTEQGLGLDAYAESRPHVRVVDAGLPGITGKRRMIRSEGYKLIYTPRFGDPLWELYDLKDDPLELRNVYAQYPDIAERLKGKLLALLKANENGAESALPGRVDEDTRQELKALGYIP